MHANLVDTGRREEAKKMWNQYIKAGLDRYETAEEKLENLLGWPKKQFNSSIGEFISDDYRAAEIKLWEAGSQSAALEAVSEREYEKAHAKWNAFSDAERAEWYEKMFSKSWAQFCK